MTIPELVTIESLGNKVGGIARPEGFPAIFVSGALPGEKVRVSAVREKKNYIEAEIVSIEKESQYRVKPFCKYYGRCGGCSLQHLEYNRQLYWKRIWIEKALRNLSTPEVDQAIPSPLTKNYRNKVTFDVHQNDLTLHAFKGNPIMVDSCPLMNQSSNEALKAFMRNGIIDGITRISVRGAVNTKSSIIEITGNVQENVPTHWPPAIMKKDKSWISLRAGEMFEKIGDFTFHIPPGGFFQVNTEAAEKMVELVLQHIPNEQSTVLDLYGGVGTFGIPLAARGHKVTSVEMNSMASISLKRTMELNDIPASKLQAINTKDTSFLTKAIRKGKSFETLVTDPPRAGMGIKTSEQLKQLNPTRIIYVSCNPFSAARDLAVLAKDNYTISQVTPVDMFPHTDHIETVFLLERIK